jgi:ABC-type glycerol-3-phosphate transport system substrate-binding protein
MKALTSIRPFQLILLVVFALFAFFGLYLFANFTGFSSGGAKVGVVTIWGTLPQSALQDELSALSTQNKAYAKVTYVQKDASTFDNDLANAIASGSGPDLILITQEELLEEEPKINVIPFSSVPQRTFLNTYLPEDTLYLTSTGTYGIPYVLDPLVLYYNKTILESAGIAQAPSSWEAVTGLAPSLSRVGPTGAITQSAVPFGVYANLEDARGILSLLFLQSGTPITAETSVGVQSVLASTQTQTADGIPPAQTVLNFFTQFSDPTRTVYSWNAGFTSARQEFLAGNLALYVGYASDEPLLKAANPNLDFDMSQIPQPQTATKKVDYGLAYAYSTALALTAKSVLPAAAEELSMAPSQNALLSTSPADSYSPVYYPEALIAQGWLSPSPAATDLIFSSMITSITSGQYQSKDALDAADQALTAAVPSSN